MKQRNGFVSNSSSAAYVLSKDVYPTIWDVAIVMLTTRDVDHDETLGKDHGFDDGELERAVRNLDTGVNATAITFSTCNFATYIWDAGDSWWVSTCTNHPFYQLFCDDGAFTSTTVPSPYVDYDVMGFIEFKLEDYWDFVEV